MRSFVINMTVIAVTLRKNQATTGVSLHTIHCFSISSLEFVYLFTHLFIYLFILHRLLDGGHDFNVIYCYNGVAPRYNSKLR